MHTIVDRVACMRGAHAIILRGFRSVYALAAPSPVFCPDMALHQIARRPCELATAWCSGRPRRASACAVSPHAIVLTNSRPSDHIGLTLGTLSEVSFEPFPLAGVAGRVARKYAPKNRPAGRRFGLQLLPWRIFLRKRISGDPPVLGLFRTQISCGNGFGASFGPLRGVGIVSGRFLP